MMDAGKTFTVTLDYDNESGDVLLPISDEMMEAAGWNLGDDVEWVDNGNGTWTIKKIEGKEWVLVETVQMFRHRYMVQVPAGKAEWALDTVTMEEAKEFSQEHLGETIVSHRVVSVTEALELCDKDNDYCKSWNEEQKMKVFFTREGEKAEL
jgi:hypothetical protein